MSFNPNYFVVKNFTEAEGDAFYELYQDSFEDEPSQKWSKQGLLDIISLEGVSVLLCGLDKGRSVNNLAGFLVWRIAQDEAEILNIGVHPDNRRKGIAAELLRRMLSQLKKAGVNKVFLEVREHNIKAKTLYIKNDFIEAGIRVAYYKRQDGGWDDAQIMSKLL